MIIRYAKSFQFIEFFIYLGTLFQSIFWIDNLNSYKSIQYSLNIVVFSITWKLQKIFSLDFQYVNSKEPFEVMRVTVFQQVLVLFSIYPIVKELPTTLTPHRFWYHIFIAKIYDAVTFIRAIETETAGGAPGSPAFSHLFLQQHFCFYVKSENTKFLLVKNMWDFSLFIEQGISDKK